MTPRILVVAGVASGVGKTTITLGLLEAYRRRGLTVQAFKVGPDFIDPGFHQLVTGRPSYNLDGWMCGRDRVLETVARHARDADLALVEGVMGCFDGFEATSEAGSTAEIAKWLGAPVVLVLDASSQVRSAAAVIVGFERYDPTLVIAAVIVNRIGGQAHARWLEEAISAACRARLVGAIPTDATLALPERHLGLVTAVEGPLTSEGRRRLAELVAASVDLDSLLALAAPLDAGTGQGVAIGADTSGDRGPARAKARTGAPGPRATIGVARDAAFQFYYAENLDRLRAAGAELVDWSPLTDATLPQVDGLYLGGGYPELYARQLAENVAIRESVRAFAAAGKPIYAECGGLMYLAATLEDLEGRPHPMVGLLPTTVRMVPRRMTLAYTAVELTSDTLLGKAGAAARGHEFHFSSIDPVPDSVRRAYRLMTQRAADRPEGYVIGGALISYVHLHFASNERLAEAFVDSCASAR